MLPISRRAAHLIGCSSVSALLLASLLASAQLVLLIPEVGGLAQDHLPAPL